MRSFRKKAVVIGVIALVWMLVGCIVGPLYCLPNEHEWNPAVPGHCYNFSNYFLGMEIAEVLIDIAILTLPIRMISGLHLPRRKKVLLGGVFLVGAFVCVTCLVRVGYLYNPHGTNGLFPTFSWVAFTDDCKVNLGKSEIWSCVQLGIAVVCACLPLYGPIVTQMAMLPLTLRESCASLLGSWSNSRLKSPANVESSTNSEYKCRAFHGSKGSSRYGKMENGSLDGEALTQHQALDGAYVVPKDGSMALRTINVQHEIDIV